MKLFNDNFLTNLGARLRLGTIFKNYPTSDVLSDILDYIMNYEGKVEVKVEPYHVYVSSEDFEFDAWNENRYYAWLNEGKFRRKNGKSYRWRSEQPTFYMMAEFRDWIREQNRTEGLFE